MSYSEVCLDLVMVSDFVVLKGRQDSVLYCLVRNNGFVEIHWE